MAFGLCLSSDMKALETRTDLRPIGMTIQIHTGWQSTFGPGGINQ